jgi:hypothetical protein
MIKRLNSRSINIIKNKYKRLLTLKVKLKYIILKSIFFNRNLICNIRNISYLNIITKKTLNKKYYKICKYSGYSKSLNKFTGYGRHELNRIAILGKLQNININS